MAKLSHVNTSDVRSAIELGCRTMQSVFNADDDDRPFFASSVHPSAELGFCTAHTESHVPGRHLLALLAAEEVASTKPRWTSTAGRRFSHTAAPCRCR